MLSPRLNDALSTSKASLGGFTMANLLQLHGGVISRVVDHNVQHVGIATLACVDE
jgi:hypothetical protein